MANLSVGDVLALARLARLEINESELEVVKDDLVKILEYLEQLKDVGVKNDKPTIQVTGLKNVMREDEVIEYQAKPDDLLKNLPRREGRYIKTKRVLE